MILGIAGKIASGKTTLLRLLEKRGFYCIEADKIVHDLYKKGRNGQILIEKYFGAQYILKNGNVNRKKLAELVFANKPKLLLLNRLIHPCVAEEVKMLLVKARSKSKNIAVEAVYFDERYLGKIVDKLILIDRDFEKAKKVLVEERGLPDEMAKRIYDSVELPVKADFVINNNGSLVDLENELLKIL